MTAKIIRFDRKKVENSRQKVDTGSNEIVEYLDSFSEELKGLTKRNREMTAKLKADRLND